MNDRYKQVFSVGVLDGEMPASMVSGHIDNMNPAILAGMLISVLDSVLTTIDDSRQIEFEKSTVDLFNYMIDARHAYTSVIPLSDLEKDD
jgi:hypothetical protein